MTGLEGAAGFGLASGQRDRRVAEGIVNRGSQWAWSGERCEREYGQQYGRSSLVAYESPFSAKGQSQRCGHCSVVSLKRNSWPASQMMM
jgi:hypothetical protein